MTKNNMCRAGIRWLSSALLAVGLTALVLINLVTNALAQRISLTWDLTHDKAYELSEQTLSILASLDEKVAIDVMCDGIDLENGGGYFAQAKWLLDQYEVRSRSVTVTYRDPAANPGFIAQYADMKLEQYDILVSCGGQTQKTNIFDLFNSEYVEQLGKQYIRSSKAEQELTSAILRVTSERTVTVAFLTGLESVYPQSLRELLSSGGYDITEASLTTGFLDTQADIAFLLSPSRDLSAEALDALNNYMENGGQFGRTLVYAPAPNAVRLPNLEAFLHQWGISYGDGLVLEMDQQRYINGKPYLSLVEYVQGENLPSHPDNVPFLSPLGRELHQEFQAQSGYETQVLLQYSPQACVMPVQASDDWQPSADDFYAYPALIRSQYTQYEGKEAKRSTVLAFAAAEALGSTSLENVSFSNAEYLLSVLGMVCGSESVIVIPAKTLMAEQMVITQSQYIVLAVIFMLLIPALTLAGGIGMWWHRKRL